MMTLADLLAGIAQGALAQELGEAASSIQIESVTIDSRLVRPNSLFVALHGMRTDGHHFIPEAITNGAVAIIAERPPPDRPATVWWAEDLTAPLPLIPPILILVPNSLTALQQAAAYWRRQHDVRVVGITGSVGKTASKELIAAVLARRYRTLRSEGNYNNEIGLPLTLLKLDPTHERAVLEMGMYDLGEIAQLAEIAAPSVGVVTNVGPTHLERLGTIERIAQAKAELPRALPSAQDGGVAILNADDPRVLAMASQTKARVLTYGLTPEADLRAENIESQGLEGVRFRLHFGREQIHAQIPLLGRHSVHTALCAAAVGLVEGLSWSEIIHGLREPGTQLRLVAVPGPSGSILLDDTYNASPASSIAAINLLAELNGRRIVVHGDMHELGSFTTEGHHLVGYRAKEVADLLIAVGKLARLIAEAALASGMPASAVHWVETNAEAIERLQAHIAEGDVILIKGSRAAKMEEIVNALTCRAGAANQRAKEA